MRHLCSGQPEARAESSEHGSDVGSSRASASEDDSSRGSLGDGWGGWSDDGAESSGSEEDGANGTDRGRGSGSARSSVSSDSGSEDGDHGGGDDDDGGGGGEYLRRYEAWGEPQGPLDPCHRETFAFLAVISCGAGMSVLHATEMLRYCRGLGGKGSLLPQSVDACWQALRAYHRAETSGRRPKKHQLLIPDNVRKFMGGGVAGAATHVEFQCEDIVHQLVGVLRSPLWSRGDVALGHEASDEYGDYCNGERMGRAQRQVGRNYGVLACTVFVDALSIDKGGFVSDTGCHVTLANVRREHRSNNAAKAPLCVMPFVDVTPAFRERLDYKRFKRAMLQWALEKIFAPAVEFNRRGGMILRVPGGGFVHFKRFLLINLSADSPQATAIAMTGSACWECEAPETSFADDAAGHARRCPATNAAHRVALLRVVNSRARDGSIKTARNAAREKGIELVGKAGFWAEQGAPEGWNLYGPSLTRDHVWGGLSAGRLHLVDEGLAVITLKMGLKLAVSSWILRNPIKPPKTGKAWVDGKPSAAQVKLYEGGMRNHVFGKIDEAVMAMAKARARCSNIELEDIGQFLHFKHGLTEFLHKDRRLNAQRYVPGVRLLQLALASSPFLTPKEKAHYFALCDLLYEVQQALSRPLSKRRWRDVEAVFTEFRLALLTVLRPNSDSGGKHIKPHMISHVVEATTQLGWWADEKRDENALAQFFKKQASRTNGRESRVAQTAAVVGRQRRLEDVCGWHGIAKSLRITWRAADHAQVGSFDVHDLTSVQLPERETCAAPAMVKWAPAAFVMMLAQRVEDYAVLTYARAVKVMLRNHAKRPGDNARASPATLRNYPSFHGNPWIDDVKYKCLGEEDGAPEELHFGRCVCFARAPNGLHYMGLRLYTFGRAPDRGPTSMEPLHLAPEDKAASYIMMPLSSLHTGALIIKDPNRADSSHYAILAPREARELHVQNGWM